MTLARSFDVDGILTGPMPSLPAVHLAPQAMPGAQARAVLDRMLGELWDLGVDNRAETLKVGAALLMYALELGLIDNEHVELWTRRLFTCPERDKLGHHEGCRTWCAYCGDIDPDDPKA